MNENEADILPVLCPLDLFSVLSPTAEGFLMYTILSFAEEKRHQLHYLEIRWESDVIRFFCLEG